ncbi:MAG: GntP family gluconate:H+ symporter [Saprospiraceae bacterium]|jgi:GntP family gluconate:H+ symporter
MIWNLVILIIVLLLLILMVSKWKVHPFAALLVAAITLGFALGMGGQKTIAVLLEGFSKTLKWIAIVVILGAFIGEVLRETGGAFRIANGIMNWVGEKRISWAMGITGYIVSIPVFVDVAYIVLQPVTEALARRSKKPILVVGLALTAGLTVSHTLLPPTPGPLAVASLLDADIGRLILINGFVGIFAMIGGILWVTRFCKDYRIDYDNEIEKRVTIKMNEEPGSDSGLLVWMDLLPIIIPILLMASGTVANNDSILWIDQVLSFVSIPLVAVLVGAVVALVQYALKRESGRSSISQLVDQAITKSALVIMITGAGGAFGYVIRESGIQDSLSAFFVALPWLGFLLPFLIAAVLTTATGSITVSLIGTASIIGPLVSTMNYSPEIIAALIGSGAFCVFHANSSFFWLLQRLHKVPLAVLYRTYTMQSLVMGISGLIAILILISLGIH